MTPNKVSQSKTGPGQVQSNEKFLDLSETCLEPVLDLFETCARLGQYAVMSAIGKVNREPYR